MTLSSFDLESLKKIQVEDIVPLLSKLEGSDVSARRPNISYKASLGRKFDFLRLMAIRLKLNDISKETYCQLRLDIDELAGSFPIPQRSLLREILEKDLDQLTLFDIEIWTEQEFFGQMFQLKERSIKPKITKLPSPARLQRKRGYRDHGHLPSQLERDRRNILKLESEYFQLIEKLKRQKDSRLFFEDIVENPMFQILTKQEPKILDLERIEAEEIGRSG